MLPRENSQVGAAVHIIESENLVKEESMSQLHRISSRNFSLGESARVLWEKNMVGKIVIINCDSQATIMAVTSQMNKFWKDNAVLLRWIPAHNGHAGTKKADSLAEKGAENSDSVLVQLPVPKTIWKGALREESSNHPTSNCNSNFFNILKSAACQRPWGQAPLWANCNFKYDSHITCTSSSMGEEIHQTNLKT